MTGKIIDRFEMKDRTALEYGAAGVVVVFQHDASHKPPAAGESVLLVRADGWLYSGKAEDVRPEPAAGSCGLFLRGLHAGDVPVGSTIRWGAEINAVQSAVA
jgi:hypothetical protein